MQTFHLIEPSGAANTGWHDGDAFIAGGTDLLQLMRADIVAPETTDRRDAVAAAQRSTRHRMDWSSARCARWPRSPRTMPSATIFR